MTAETDRTNDLSPEPRQGDRVPDTEEEQHELVDETIDESFPASDPPSYWGRDTSDDDASDDR
jgi:hypothetical protein